MRLLVLGGTKFLGRAAVEAALARGAEVTLFNRGETNPGLFPEVEKLRGDRDGDLSALEGREWDAVIDPSGYVPRVVRQSAEVRRRIGVVFQTQSLDKALTVGENLRSQGHLHGLSGATLRERMESAMKRLGILDRRNDVGVDVLPRLRYRQRAEPLSAPLQRGSGR